MEAKAKWQCPKCRVGLPYNPTYKIEGLCSTCRTYDDSDRLLGGHRLKKSNTYYFATRLTGDGSTAVNFYDNFLDCLDNMRKALSLTLLVKNEQTCFRFHTIVDISVLELGPGAPGSWMMPCIRR